MPLAQMTVAACIWLSGTTREWPIRLKMAPASSRRFLPFSFEQMQVIDRPTEMAVLGMARMIWRSVPRVSSILAMLNPVMVEMMT